MDYVADMAGVAKSELFCYMDRLSTRSQLSSGGESSGVTGSVVKNPVTGLMTLEALMQAAQGNVKDRESALVVESPMSKALKEPGPGESTAEQRREVRKLLNKLVQNAAMKTIVDNQAEPVSVEFRSRNQLRKQKKPVTPNTNLIPAGLTSILFRYNANNELLDAHRNPVVTDVDYADASLEDELMLLKSESHMPTEFNFSNKTEHDEVSTIKECPVCGKESLFTCKNCYQVSYCSRDHQKAHWKNHKNNCIVYEVMENEKYGRHLVAKVNIKASDLIFKEDPLLVSPTGPDTHLEDVEFKLAELTMDSELTGSASKEDILKINEESDVIFVLCLGCCTQLPSPSENFSVRCDKCGWPLCSDSCTGIKNHSLECSYFQEMELNYAEIENEYIIPPRLYFVLRCLLIESKDPKTASKIMKLQSHIGERLNYESRNGRKLNEWYMAFLLRTIFKIEELSPEKVLMLLGVLDTNGFYAGRLLTYECVTAMRVDVSRNRKHVSIYETGSYLTHSCVPNAIAIVRDPASIEVVACTDIKKGEVITVDYDYLGFLRPRMERRKLLELIHFFVCDCPLCSDPTEYGLFLSGVLCLRCRRKKRDGIFLPINPIDENTEWKCTNCSLVKTSVVVCTQIQEVNHQIFSSDESCLKTAIQEPSSNVLHQNNILIVHAQFQVIRILYNQMTNEYCTITLNDITRLIELLGIRLNIVRKISSPYNKCVVNLQLQLAEVIVVHAFKSGDRGFVKALAEKLENIHDDLVELVPKTGFTNGMHAYILFAVRAVRVKLRQIYTRIGHLKLESNNQIRRKFLKSIDF